MTFTLFILYVVLAYTQPGEIVPALAPYRVTYWVGLAGLASAVLPVLGRRGAPVATLQLWVLLAFAAVAGASLMIAERWLGAPALLLRRFGPSLIMFVLAICGVTSLARLRIAAGCVVALTLALMLQGAAAYHFGYNARLFLLDRDAASGDADPIEDEVEPDQPAAPVWQELVEEDERHGRSRIRALGFMNDPNDLAMGLIVAFGLVAGAWKPGLRLRSLSTAAAAGALVYGIYLTRSRGGATALVVVLWRLTANRVGRLPALAVLAVLGTGALALDFGGRSMALQGDDSATDRVVAWTEGLEMLKAQPILGVGYGQFLEHHTLTAHNSLVLCFAETGLIGCFFWVGLFVITLLELHAVKSLPGDEPFDDTARRWAQALQLALVGFMAAAFFLSRTFVPTLYLVIGLSTALARISREAGRPVLLPAPPALAMLVLACEMAGISAVYTIVKLNIA